MTDRVLITGGAGFVAHHVVGHLLRHTDFEVVTLDRLDYSGNLNRLHDLMLEFPEQTRRRLRVVHHDLRAELNPLVRADVGQVRYILHLAAGSHVDRSIANPMEFVQDNVVGTCNILEFARRQEKLERFVYFSTGEVFGPAPPGVKYAENDRYNSGNPYSASKAGGEELAVAYENTYGLPVYCTHTMNVFGQRQHPEKFIPMCIRLTRERRRVYIHADPTKKVPGSRHYVHAQDVADALLFLLQRLPSPEPWVDYGGAKCQKFNIVGSEEWDNLRVAAHIASAVGQELDFELVDFHSSRPGHDLRYALDGDRMASLGWKPRPVTERLAEVVRWTLDNPRWLEVAP